MATKDWKFDDTEELVILLSTSRAVHNVHSLETAPVSYRESGLAHLGTFILERSLEEPWHDAAWVLPTSKPGEIPTQSYQND